MNKTTAFLQRIDALAKQPIPHHVMERAKRSLLDYICVTLAGTKYQKDKIEKYLEFACPEQGEYTAIGVTSRIALKEAVFLNGLNGHALDFDDGTNTGIIHLGSPIFSVLLPLSQKYGCTYEQVLRAAIIGYEASFTMALSIQPGHKLMGYHATGTCGTLGTTLAIAYLLDFSEEERKQAFATACVSASGMLKVLDDGSELKPYNVAKTALLALSAAQIAKAGFKGHPDALSGDRGFLKMMTGNADIALQAPLYKGTYAIEKTYTKPYAACRYCHPSIEAAIRLKSRVDPADIEAVDIKTYSLAVKGHEHTDIPSVSSAKMSIPYSVAVGFQYGKAGLAEYCDAIVNDATVQALVRKVHVTEDEALSKAFPEEQTAIVTVSTKSGSYTQRVDFPKGEPENPMSEEEFRKRFDEMCIYAGYSCEKASVIYQHVKKAEGTVGELCSLLGGFQ